MDDARKLLAALLRGSRLPCLIVRALLPLMAAYERGGQDADNVALFRALGQHFDACAACLDRYERMSER